MEVSSVAPIGNIGDFAMTTVQTSEHRTQRRETFATDAAKWHAVQNRDAAADGRFFYSVKSTGVFCYPSCAARLPLRRNVAFHDNREAAQRAGFRPCKRCKPDLPPRAERYVGTARYAFGDTSLGPVIVAANERGICTILLGDDAASLHDALTAQLDGWKLVPAGPDFAAQIARVEQLIDSPAAQADLPLDPQGTAFQHKVWAALRTIPAGRTASYAEIARQIGAPNAARAVARACAANALAVAIPCHRVVRGDGSLSGYRWGAERKRCLLEREAA